MHLEERGQDGRQQTGQTHDEEEGDVVGGGSGGGSGGNGGGHGRVRGLFYMLRKGGMLHVDGCVNLVNIYPRCKMTLTCFLKKNFRILS